MRKETKEIMQAFLAGKPLSRRRTYTDGQHVWLHGNLIAWRETDASYRVTVAGYGTTTTRERLNGLLDMLGCGWGFCQIKGEQYVYNWKAGDNHKQPVGTREVLTVEDQRESESR